MFEWSAVVTTVLAVPLVSLVPVGVSARCSGNHST